MFRFIVRTRNTRKYYYFICSFQCWPLPNLSFSDRSHFVCPTATGPTISTSTNWWHADSYFRDVPFLKWPNSIHWQSVKNKNQIKQNVRDFFFFKPFADVIVPIDRQTDCFVASQRPTGPTFARVRWALRDCFRPTRTFAFGRKLEPLRFSHCESIRWGAIVADESTNNDRCPTVRDAIDWRDGWPLGRAHFGWHLWLECDCPACSVQRLAERQPQFGISRRPLWNPLKL